MVEFFSKRLVKASRKARRCDECRHVMEAGEPYVSWSQKSDGEFYTGAAHPDCLEWASRAIKDDGDGRPFLCDADELEWDADDAWITANPPPPAVYARLPDHWRAHVDDLTEGRSAPNQDGKEGE